jgi:hypothetical protein
MKASRMLAAIALTLSARAGEPGAGPGSQIDSVIESTSGWESTAALYAPLMGIQGDIGVGGVTTTVDVPFGDILDQVDGGLTAAFEARHDRWSLTGDFMWMKISASAQPAANSYLAFKEDQTTASLTLGYELYGTESTSFDLLAGGTYTGMDVDLDLFTPRLPVSLRTGAGSQEWIDPFVGLRLRQQLSDRWGAWIRGDYGGLGVSSEEYWQLVAGISYRIGESTSLALAYRMIHTTYQQGDFAYDVEMSGPNLGLVFRFQ